MPKKWISLTLLFGSLAAFAAPGPAGIWNATAPLAADQDYFASLQKMFQQEDATAGTLKEVAGWWTGRCFSFQDHQTAVATVMATQEVGGSDHGPLFPGDKVTKVLLGMRTDRASDWFDQVGPNGRKKIQSFIDSSAKVVTTPVEASDGLTFDYISDTGFALKYQIRRVPGNGAQYFIVQGTLLKATDQQQEGDTNMMCYYFDKVKFVDEDKPDDSPAPTVQPGDGTVHTGGDSTVIAGHTEIPDTTFKPYCRCYCAGPPQPVSYRCETGLCTSYQNVPLFPSTTDGTVEYRMFSGTDAYACQGYIGQSCEGYQDYHGGQLSGFASGQIYGCEIFRL